MYSESQSSMGIPPAYFTKKDMKSFGLTLEDAQGKDDRRLKTKGQLANLSLPGKWPLKRCACDFNSDEQSYAIYHQHL